MITQLLHFDTSLFLYINHLPHNDFFDSFFALLSGVGAYGSVWVVTVLLLIVLKEIPSKKIFFVLCLTIFITLIIVNTMKTVVQRPRPEFTQPNVIVVQDMTETYAFPSAHAAVAFASAVVLAKKHRKFSWLYFVLAALIAFSRIYLGKHYPSDVVAGFLIGNVIGYSILSAQRHLG